MACSGFGLCLLSAAASFSDTCRVDARKSNAPTHNNAQTLGPAVTLLQSVNKAMWCGCGTPSVTHSLTKWMRLTDFNNTPNLAQIRPKISGGGDDIITAEQPYLLLCDIHIFSIVDGVSEQEVRGGWRNVLNICEWFQGRGNSGHLSALSPQWRGLRTLLPLPLNKARIVDVFASLHITLRANYKRPRPLHKRLSHYELFLH